jgi:hypothetical protein
MDWKDVGAGAALVGSLLTGNVPGAVAAGVSLVTSATGEASPEKVLSQLQAEPVALLRLRELALQDEVSIREHIRQMTELELSDRQAEHHEAQETIRAGDRAEDPFVRRTRPAQSWLSLIAGIAYLLAWEAPSVEIALILFALPWAYAGLRQVGKGLDSLVSSKRATNR